MAYCQCPLCWALGDRFPLSHVADPFRQVRSKDRGKQKRNLREKQRVPRIGLPRRDLGIFSCLPPELRACLSAIPAAVTQGTPNWSQAAEGLGFLSACRTHLIGPVSCVELIGPVSCVESCSSANPTLESSSPLQTAPLQPRGLSCLLLLRGRGGCPWPPFHVPPEAGRTESGEGCALGLLHRGPEASVAGCCVGRFLGMLIRSDDLEGLRPDLRRRRKSGARLPSWARCSHVDLLCVP